MTHLDIGVANHDFLEVTAQSTTNAALEDISGLTFDLTLPRAGCILATMCVQCSSTGGAPATGAWAISINSVDGNEIQRYLSGTNDTGSVTVTGCTSTLPAATYTVQGRHRRVAGTSTVNTDRGQLLALAVME